MKILIIEDVTSDFLLLERFLRLNGIDGEFLCIASNQDLERALQSSWDVVLSDYNVPGMDFRITLQRIHKSNPELPVILVSGSVGEEMAVELLRLGMVDFVFKNNLIRLVPAMRRAIEEVNERRIRHAAEKVLHETQERALKVQRQAQLAAMNLMEDAIIARNQAETINAALLESEQRLMLAQEGAHVGIWDWDISNDHSYWSPECFRIYGLAPGELKRNEDFLARVHPDDLPLFEAVWATHIMQGKPFEVEFRFRRDSGEVCWLVSKGQAQYDEDGKPIRLSGINLDITERKNSEQQLRKLVEVVEQSPVSTIITCLDGNIEYVNEAFIQVSGYRREELMGQNPRVLKSGKTSAEIYLKLWDTLKSGKTWKGEFVNKRKDGSEYVEYAIIIPIRDADGSISHYAGLKEDISDKKRLNEELDQHRHHLEALVKQRTLELETAWASADAANRAKSSFLANMSHEIRTPMNAIIGMTYLLRRSGLSAEQNERLNKIDTATQHLLSIINDILDISKIEAGHMQLEEVDFSLSVVLDNIYSMISDKARAKGLSIRFDCEQVPKWLRGDPTRLRQALLNYADNAVKFTESGEICLGVHVLEESGEGLLIRFEFQDSGVGIAEDKLPLLFEAFAQADVSTTRKFGGTGLGLAITRRLASMMGGDAGVISTVGKGSTFWFTSRLQRGQGQMPERSEAAEAAEVVLRRDHSGARVLLVEDNLINREVALELLYGVGLAVHTAKNGLIALEKASKMDYDLILMDVQMPVMDGLTATQMIRAQPGQASLPILAMTSNAFNEDRQACLAAGMDDFVAKPVMPAELYASLLRWLSKKGQPGVAPAKPESADKTLAASALTTPQDSAIPQTLPPIDGMDYAPSLLVLRGNITKYKALLRLFAQSHKDDMHVAIKLLADGDTQAVRHLAHGLKGVSSTLGAYRVCALVTQLENALLKNAEMNECMELVRLCDSELRRLAEVILDLPNAPQQTCGGEIDPGPIKQILAEMESLLTQSNIRAGRLASESDDQLRVIFGDRYTDFMRQLEIFDYEKALAILKTSPYYTKVSD
ncbi:MAG: response regulator [Methylicorpusculum sp.]|uniref:response regulator n=1 Tax=Methylicorpusculum sp. TaxID=2713644 RepID=UPI002726E8B5|nr:response regulator [Methylicorpusculum sp.]MDO8937935.1 response regulator [Methylicorpusculum sp.]MDP2200378.1 response regulator [Methylicorpusculum sp.]